MLGIDSEKRISSYPDYADSPSAHLHVVLSHMGSSVAHLLLLQGQGSEEHQAFNPHVNDAISTWHQSGARGRAVDESDNFPAGAYGYVDECVFLLFACAFVDVDNIRRTTSRQESMGFLIFEQLFS